MTWNLFIDDERMPTDVTWGNEAFYSVYPWTIARNLNEVQTLVADFGFPQFISFDHDLSSNEPSGKDIANWLVAKDLDGVYKFPTNFQYFVHSRNPVGKVNIEGLLNDYICNR